MASPMWIPPPLDLARTLAERSSRLIDFSYTGLVHSLGLTHRFFRDGFGDLSIIDVHRDVAEVQREWPPAHFNQRIPWKRKGAGKVGDRHYVAFEARYPSPALEVPGLGDALPRESREAVVAWLAPADETGRVLDAVPTAVHLAATGDHGFARRAALARPLLGRGVGALLLESPFYGARRPEGQSRAKLRQVSELFVLGRATIEEASHLLFRQGTEGGWTRAPAEADRGEVEAGPLGGTGSEAPPRAASTLVPAAGAADPWSAPPSRRPRLCVAGLSMGAVHACLTASFFPREVALAGLLSPRSAAGAYCAGALAVATDWEAIARDAADETSGVARRVRDALASAGRGDASLRLKPSRPGERVLSAEALASERRARLLAAEGDASRAARFLAGEASEGGVARSDALAGVTAFGGAPSPSFGSPTLVYSPPGPPEPALDLLCAETSDPRERDALRSTRELLASVMEAYTDVTRFPPPVRPDAAVFVGATADGYVSTRSVRETAAAYPGSDLRWVRGGHITSFLVHQDAFREAVHDALERL